MRMMRWSLAVTLLGLVACSDGKDEPVDTDTVEPETVVEDTAEETPDTPEPQLPDTGTEFVLSLEGQADIEPGVFLGHEAQTWRFINPDQTRLTKPRCVFAWDAINWANAPSRFGRVDPLAAHQEDCDSCLFTFTVSMESRERRFDLPWDTDTDVDTDPPDTDADTLLPGGFKDEDPTTAPFDCYTLEAIGAEQALLAEDRWVGYGFDPTLGTDDDETTGALMVWDSLNGIWVPYLYDVPFRDGKLSWATIVQGYELTY
jgi:hypothetical protein